MPVLCADAAGNFIMDAAVAAEQSTVATATSQPQSLLPQLSTMPPVPQPESAACTPMSRLFPNMIYIAGMKHLMDNSVKDSLGAMKHYKTQLQNMRAVETMVKPRAYRDKLKHSIMKNSPMIGCLESWEPSLKGLRWHAVVEFAAKLLPFSSELRARWDPKEPSRL